MPKMDRFKLDILAAIFLRGFSAILLFVFYQQISKKLGVNGAGIFGVIFSIQTIGVLLCNLGYNESIVKYIAKSFASNDIQSLNQIINTARLKVFPYAIISIILTFAYVFINKLQIFDSEVLFFQISLIAFPIIFTEQNAAVLRGIGVFQLSWVLIGIAVPATMLLFLNWLPFSYLSISVVVNFYIIINWVVMIISFMLVSVKLQNKTFVNIKSFVCQCGFKGIYSPLINTSHSLYIISIFTAIMELDIILIDYWFGIGQAGIYNIIKKISLSTSMLLLAVNSVIAPQLSVLFEENNHEDLKKLVKKIFVLISLYAIPITFIVIFFSEDILKLFGQEFITGKKMLLILTAGQFINIMTGPVGNILIMGGNERVLQNITIYISCLGLIGYFILIPLYGITGAAWVTALRVMLQNIIMFYFVVTIYIIEPKSNR